MQTTPRVLFFILLFTVFCSPSFADQPAAKDTAAPPAQELKDSDAAASVNGVQINYGDYRRQYASIKQRFFVSQGKEITPAESEKLKTSVLDNLIAAELLEQAAKNNNVAVSDDEVNEHIKSFTDRVGGEEELQKQLEKANLTIDQLKEKVKSQIAAQKFIEQESSKVISTTEQEKKDYYDTHPTEFDRPEMIHASHILVRVQSDASEADVAKAKTKIEEALKKARGGEDFDKLAIEYSEGPSGPKGGDLGWVTKGRMVPDFEKAAFSLKAGEISDVVRTNFGFHIIKVTEVREAHHFSYQEVKDQIGTVLMRQKIRPWIQEYVKELRAKAKVEVHL